MVECQVLARNWRGQCPLVNFDYHPATSASCRLHPSCMVCSIATILMNINSVDTNISWVLTLRSRLVRTLPCELHIEQHIAPRAYNGHRISILSDRGRPMWFLNICLSSRDYS